MKQQSGKNNFKGINSQAWAAMSLFLQYINRPDFRYIGFEKEKLEDFCLVFEDGRKIICESKDSEIGLAKIREILDKIIEHRQLNTSDEILIICRKVAEEAKRNIENFRFFEKLVRKTLLSKQHKFNEKHFKILPQLKFWEVEQETNIRAVKLLFAQTLNRPGSFWVPEHILSDWVCELMIVEVYFGSQKGEILTKDDFLKKLEERKIKHLADFGVEYEKEKQISLKKINGIIRTIKDKKDLANSEISKLVLTPSLHLFTLQKLLEKNDVNLASWENFWQATLKGAFSVHVFDIFKNNIENEENRQFVIKFIDKNLNNLSGFYREEFIKTDIVNLCHEVINKTRKYDREIFEIVKKLLVSSVNELLYLKVRYDNHWEREETANLLTSLYDKTVNEKLKKEIVGYVSSVFNLIDDDSVKFWHYTPPCIFEIIKKHIGDSIDEFLLFKGKCVEQFQKFYQKHNGKYVFQGWELEGSGISQSGSEFSISDRCFVELVLTLALREIYKQIYKQNELTCLDFIKDKFFAKPVSAENPDFLRRAALPILMDMYRNTNQKISDAVFSILKNFVEERKGIPWKSDLIFQELRKKEYSDDKKWRLVKASLKKFGGLPVNVFVEQIVFNIASTPVQNDLSQEAEDIIADWVKNPKYEVQRMISIPSLFANNISQLIENKTTFARGVKIFKNYIDNPNFIKKDDDWNIWDTAKVLAKIISIDFNRGLSILKNISTPSQLSFNQQILIVAALNDLDNSDNDLLIKVYRDFLKPLLDKMNNKISKIEKKIPNRYAREQIIQFTEKLAKVGTKGCLSAAFHLLKIFAQDSDPPRDGSNYPDDPKGEFNDHEKIARGEEQMIIRSVRGWCCFAMQQLILPRNPGTIEQTRRIIKNLLPILRELAFDKNYYVRFQSCVPLIPLVNNHHRYLEGKPNERFMPEDLAKEIENLAFDMLKDEKNQGLKAVMKHLAIVFSYAQTFGTKKAKKCLQTFLNSKYQEVIDEILPLLIFYALFRKDAFPKWPWKKLEFFDDRLF